MAVSIASQGRDSDLQPPIAQTLLVLAPLRLPNGQRTRSLGSALCVPLERFVARDQTLVRSLFETLTALHSAIVDPTADDLRKWRNVTLWAEPRKLDNLLNEVGELGTATREWDADETLAIAIHDVRGGALCALLGRLQMLDCLRQTADELNVLFVLVRDHLNIMRNAIGGLASNRRSLATATASD